MKYNNKLDPFFESLYQSFCESQKNAGFPDNFRKENFQQYKEKTTARLRECLGITKLEQMKTPFTVRSISGEERSSVSISLIEMEILPHFIMPVCILTPKVNPRLREDGSVKTILYCHGHGEGGFLDCLDEHAPMRYHKNAPLVMAQEGYRVYMYEPAGFGDFIVENYDLSDADHCVSNCEAPTGLLHLYGLTTVGLRVFQAMCLTEYITATTEHPVHAAVGISGGGQTCLYTSLLSPQIQATVISGYANLFQTSIMHISHCVDNYIPNTLSFGELPYIMGLLAPKPLFVTNGLSDPIFPVAGTKQAIAVIQSIYSNLDMEDNLKWELFEGAHEFSFLFLPWLNTL